MKLTSCVVYSVLATFILIEPAIAKDGHGLNLDKPGLIDAVASVLFPYQQQEGFTRVDDDTVLVELPGFFTLQLQKLPGHSCSFQTRQLNETLSVVQQYNFAQLTGEYRTTPSGSGSSTIIHFPGEAAWCMKDKNGLQCWNEIPATVYGLNDSRKVMRAMSFIQRNYCAPAQPKQPF